MKKMLFIGAGMFFATACDSGGGGGTNAPPVAPVALVQVSLSTRTLTQGATATASALLLDAGENILTGRTVYWSCGPATVATMDASGLITGVGPGVATIMAMSEGVFGDALISVVPPTTNGSWTGVVGSSVLAITLAEIGDSVTGAGTLSNTPSGLLAETVSGHRNGPTVQLTLTAGTAPPISLQATLAIDAMTGSISGSGFNGGAIALYRRDTKAPNQAAWVGSYTLVSDQGQPPGATISVLGYPTQVFWRSFGLIADGRGVWGDSTMSALNCPAGTVAMCSKSGTASVAWVANDATTLVLVSSVSNGYVVARKVFVRQADGTLLKTDDGQIEVYRRQ